MTSSKNEQLAVEKIEKAKADALVLMAQETATAKRAIATAAAEALAPSNPTFTRNVALALGSLFTIAAIGWTASMTLNKKAEASDMQKISVEVQELKTLHAVGMKTNEEVARRLENIEAQIKEIAKSLRVPIISIP